MDETNIHTIAYFQRYILSFRLPKLPIWGFRQIYDHGLEDPPEISKPSIKDHRKSKIYIYRDMERNG